MDLDNPWIALLNRSMLCAAIHKLSAHSVFINHDEMAYDDTITLDNGSTSLME